MPWYDDPALYFAAPGDVLAQGDIIIAATGTFEGNGGDVAPASPLNFGEDRYVAVWRGSTGALPEAPILGLQARWVLRWFCRMLAHSKKNSTNASQTWSLRGRRRTMPSVMRATIPRSIDSSRWRHSAFTMNLHRSAERASKPPRVWELFPFRPMRRPEFRRHGSTCVASRPPTSRSSTSSRCGLLRFPGSHRRIFRRRLQNIGRIGTSRYAELQRAFGQRIVEIVPISTGKKMRVGFTLEDGAQFVFEAAPSPE